MKQIILQILVLNFRSKRQARSSPGQEISCFVLSTCLLPFVLLATSWQMTNDNHGYCHALCSYSLWLFWGNSCLGKVKKRRKIFPIHFFPGTSELPIGELIQLLPASYGVKVSKLGHVCNTRLDNTPCYQRFMLHQSQSGAVPSGVRAVN